MKADPAVTPLPQQLDYHQIAALSPFGEDWLQVDRVVSWTKTSIVVQRAISGSDRNMSAHLRQGPSIMPGVLQIETVNQALVLLMIVLNHNGDRNDDLAGVGVMGSCRARWHAPAYIGDTLTVTVSIVEVVGKATAFDGRVMVGDRLVSTISVLGTQVAAPPPVRAQPPVHLPPRDQSLDRIPNLIEVPA